MSRSRERLANQRAAEATKKVQVAPATPLDNRTKSILTVIQARPPQINYREEAFQKKKRENKKYQKVESEMKKIWDGKYVYTNDKTHKNLKRNEYNKLPAQDRQDYTQKVSNDWDHKRDRKPFRQWVDHQFEEEHPHEKDEMFRQERKKIYQKAEDDPLLTHTLHKAEQEFEQVKADISPLDPPLPQADIAQIKQAIEDKHMEKFVQELPEKAAVYQEQDPHIQRAVHLHEERHQQEFPDASQGGSEKHTNKPSAPLLSSTSTPFPVIPNSGAEYFPEDYRDQEFGDDNEYIENVPAEEEIEIESAPEEEPRENRHEEQHYASYSPAPRRDAEDISVWRENNRRQAAEQTRNDQNRRGGGPPSIGKAGKNLASKFTKRLTRSVLKRTGTTAARALMAEPWFWVALAIILLLLIIAYVLIIKRAAIQFDTAQENQASSNVGVSPNSIPGLTKFTKTGPEHVDNGQIITYTISAEYSGSASVKVQDAIPTNTEFVDCNGCQKTGNTVSWTLAKGSNSFNLSVRPTANDIIVVNQAQALSSRGGVSGTCPSDADIRANRLSPESCKYLAPAVDIFNTSFSDSQLQTYIDAYQKQSPRSVEDFTQKAKRIVQLAQEVGINPIIPLSYWRSESGFGNGFGCPGVSNDFDSQVYCILGGPPNSSWSTLYSDAARCARDGHEGITNSPACNFVAGRIAQHSTIYGPANVKVPIKTLDDLAEMIGSRNPDLENYLCATGSTSACSSPINRNCTHTYNILLETFTFFATHHIKNQVLKIRESDIMSTYMNMTLSSLCPINIIFHNRTYIFNFIIQTENEHHTNPFCRLVTRMERPR
jgi:uncharacterized repeat protein (TIGR01451 family)